MTRLLITGGAGFIGSHTCLVLLEAGYKLIVLDDFSNSSLVALERVQELSGKSLQWIRGDVRDASLLDKIFRSAGASDAPIEGVIHFAGLKAVSESIIKPLIYWDVNVAGTGVLLRAMETHNCRTLVFSSSATIYGCPEVTPIAESAPVQPINPYGHSKAAVEQLINNVVANAPDS